MTHKGSMCCFIPIQREPFTACGKPAEWTITFGPTPDDYTESCTEHVGHLLTDAPVHTVHRLEDSV
jgi:hypothetical protein